MGIQVRLSALRPPLAGRAQEKEKTGGAARRRRRRQEERRIRAVETRKTPAVRANAPRRQGKVWFGMT
jgi:hypothetical protein